MEAVSRPAVTLDAVARAAGVSRATASRVFTGSSQVSDEARKAVERAAAQLGYVPNRAARSLAAGRSESVGVVVLDPEWNVFQDPSFPRLMRGIAGELEANGLQMVLFAPQSAADSNRLEQYLAGGHVDAVLLLNLVDHEVLPDRLRARGIPVVLGGKPRSGLEISFVHVDNHSGARRATEHLIGQGRRRIAHLATDSHCDRLQGFREAMWNAALRGDLVEHGADNREGGEMAMAKLLSQCEDIDAVFAASDAMAIGAMWVMQALGRRIPDDVAIIGFDDSPHAASTQPPLSSVRRPMEDMGREMTRLVLSMAALNTHGPLQKILDPELAVRESTSKPALALP
ncbi:MAG TPA: LacI family DNA-binding transcriptional regulator [Candidatus Dormibacteraeota bacterium]|nr:LacI family DNA-binding transcriptional regulator [Candidatus Dormibacteraeota bacterium]